MKLQAKTTPSYSPGKASNADVEAGVCQPAERLLSRLDRVRPTGPNVWIACCPGHRDRSPSLSIKQAGDRVLIHCFAGCEPGAILGAVGLTLADLFHRPTGSHHPPLRNFHLRRNNQAREALVALAHEVQLLWCLAEQMHAGFNLDPAERERLKLAMGRICVAKRWVE